jgi:hypothetical protein
MKPIPLSFLPRPLTLPSLRTLILSVATLLVTASPQAASIDSAFTYQGYLSVDGTPADGPYDIRSILYNAEVGGSQIGNILTNQNVSVHHGLVHTTLDFGPDLFDGQPLWLELALRPGDTSTPFVPLSPRQPLRPAPYASHAVTAQTAFSAATATSATSADLVPWSGILNLPPDFADGIDRDTTYEAGDGLELTDTTFALADQGVTTTKLADQSVTPAKLNSSNASTNQALLFNGTSVVWTNLSWNSLADIPPDFADGVDRDTTYEAGDGLELADQTFQVRFDGSGSASTAARSDHSHPPGDAATLAGLEPDAFAPAIHPHTFDQITGTLAENQLPPNLPSLDADQSFTGINEFAGITLLTNQANLVHGSFTGDATGLFNLPGHELIPGSVGSQAIASQSVTRELVAPATLAPENLDVPAFNTTFWSTRGNSDTTINTHFLGTTDLQPLELRANATRALRLIPNSTNSVNLIAGSSANDIDEFTVGATIAGGGATSHLGFPHANLVYGDFSTIGGGSRNLVDITADWSTIAGGLHHTIELNAQWSTISGGLHHSIGIDADFATISGGKNNHIEPNTESATISGGSLNTITTNAHFAAIPGGHANLAAGRFSLAAGHHAHALHDGAFVWADSLPQPVASSHTNQVTLRATGGVRLFTDPDLNSGVELEPGSGSWLTLSDRDAKANFQPANPRVILDQLDQLPILYWNYHAQDPSTRHLGPVAQDFHAAFQLGSNPRRIATVDVDGVALAAIQGLNQKLEQELETRDRELLQLRSALATLTAQVEALRTASATAAPAEGLRVTNP